MQRFNPNSSQLSHFIDAGYELIPLNQYDAVGKNGKKVGKAPTGRNWHLKPSLTLAEAEAHMAAFGNVGVRLRLEQLVIDVDPRNFEHDIDSFNELLTEYPELRDVIDSAPSVLTGSRTEDNQPGEHYYLQYRIPKHWGQRDRIRKGLKRFPGVEFKTIGTQLLAVGCIHPETELAYTWRDWNEDKSGPAQSFHEMPVVPEALFNDLWFRPIPKDSLVEGADFDEEMLAEYLAQIDPVEYRGKHDEWLQLMIACHAATLGGGIEEFVAWSTSDDDYAHAGDEIAYRWDTFDADGEITSRTLNHIAEVKGINMPRRPERDFADTIAEDKALVQYAEELSLPHMNKAGDKIKDTMPNALVLVDSIVREKDWRVRYNTLHRQVEISGSDLPWDTGRYKSVSQQLIDDRLWLLVNQYFPQHKFDRGISPNNIAFAFNILAQADCYNPLTEYLNQLQWDGEERIGKWFIDRFGAQDTALNREASTLFFRALVTRAHAPGTKYDMLMVLEGKQGSGKSSGLKALCPNEDWFTDHPFELSGNGNPADAIMPFLGKWIHEFPEVSTLTPVTMNKAKAMISKPVDQFRKPYGRGFEDAPRGYVTVGTTNDSVYLSDMTGNRRFLPIALDNRMIDIKAIAEERDQLFAEAQALYLKDPDKPLHLPSELWSTAADEADQRQADHPWVDILEHYLEGRTRIAAIELYPQVGIKGTRGSTEAKALAAVMRRLGWSRKKAIKIPADEIPGAGAFSVSIIQEGKAYAGYVLDIAD